MNDELLEVKDKNFELCGQLDTLEQSASWTVNHGAVDDLDEQLQCANAALEQKNIELREKEDKINELEAKMSERQLSQAPLLDSSSFGKTDPLLPPGNSNSPTKAKRPSFEFLPKSVRQSLSVAPPTHGLPLATTTAANTTSTSSAPKPKTKKQAGNGEQTTVSSFSETLLEASQEQKSPELPAASLQMGAPKAGVMQYVWPAIGFVFTLFLAFAIFACIASTVYGTVYGLDRADLARLYF